jgi:hypothetical protein
LTEEEDVLIAQAIATGAVRTMLLHGLVVAVVVVVIVERRSTAVAAQKCGAKPPPPRRIFRRMMKRPVLLGDVGKGFLQVDALL